MGAGESKRRETVCTLGMRLCVWAWCARPDVRSQNWGPRRGRSGAPRPWRVCRSVQCTLCQTSGAASADKRGARGVALCRGSGRSGGALFFPDDLQGLLRDGQLFVGRNHQQLRRQGGRGVGQCGFSRCPATHAGTKTGPSSPRVTTAGAAKKAWRGRHQMRSRRPAATDAGQRCQRGRHEVGDTGDRQRRLSQFDSTGSLPAECCPASRPHLALEAGAPPTPLTPTLTLPPHPQPPTPP